MTPGVVELLSVKTFGVVDSLDHRVAALEADASSILKSYRHTHKPVRGSRVVTIPLGRAIGEGE